MAGIGGSFTNVERALKYKYDTNFRGYVGWSKGVLAAMVSKVKWGGRRAVIPLRVGNSPARSASFTKAQTKSQTKFTAIKNFELQWAKDYAVARIDGLLMEAAADNDAAMFDDLCAQVDGGLDGTMHSFSTKIYRNGYGAIGVIDSSTTISSQNIVLEKREDGVLFEVGMDIVLSQSDHANVLRGSGGTLTVDQITDNGTTCTVHVTAAINSLSGAATGDTIFPDGDRQDSATPSFQCIPGLDAWLLPASSGADFTNVDRSLDFRLQGTLVDVSSSGIDEEQALISAVTETGRFGGRPKWAFLNPTRYQNLVNLGMTRFRPTTVKGPAGIGFSGVSMQTSYGEVEVFSDPYCPVRRGYVIDPATFKYYGAGSSEVPRFLNHDKAGNILRVSDDDGAEARMGYYGTTGMNAPIKNAVIKFEAGA